jgi:hypothetical protein
MMSKLQELIAQREALDKQIAETRKKMSCVKLSVRFRPWSPNST